MPGANQRPNRSIWGAVILIALGAIFLLANLGIGLNPWSALAKYWPLILICVGIAGIVDYFRARSDPNAAASFNAPAAAIVFLGIVIICGAALWRHRGRESYLHDNREVDLAGASSVRARIDMPAGHLEILPGGSSPAEPSLLGAHFDYSSQDGDPIIDYNVVGTEGEMKITQTQPTVHFGNSDNSWQLRFANDVPLDLTLHMGAGQGDLNLGALNLTNLKINLGAGQLQLNLRGDRKTDLDATIQGGVGQATILLPTDVGVRVHAHGGLGSINTQGLTREGDDYVNDALGKSPATIRLTVQGGVGEVDLDAGP